MNPPKAKKGKPPGGSAARVRARIEKLEQQLGELRAQLPGPEENPAPAGGAEPLVAFLEETLHAGSWHWEAPAGQMRWSDELFRILGVEPGAAEPSMEAFFERVHPDDRTRVRAGFRLFAQAGTPSPVPCRLVRPSGEVLEVTLHGSPTLARRDSARGVVGIVRDVTEARQAEAKAQEHRDLLHAVFDFLPLGLTLKNLEGRYLYVNRHFARQVGAEPEDILGRTLSEVPGFVAAAGPAGLRQMLQEDAEAISTGRPVEREGHLTPLYPGRRAIRRTKFPFFGADNQPAGVITLSEDITERRAVEEQLRQAQKLELVGQLAGGVAHDFNNALQVAHGFTQLGLRNLENRDFPAVTENLQNVLNACESATAITRKLLAFGRQQVLKPEPVVVNEVLQNATELLNRSLREDIELVLEMPGQPLMVKADSVALEQVIMSLCVNSRDAMPQGGRITIGSEPETPPAAALKRHGLAADTPMVRISIRDNGAGIDPALLKRVFEPFFTTKEVGKGTGLGLAMVDGLTAQHGGFVEISSTPGAFTQVDLFLPEFVEEGSRPGGLEFSGLNGEGGTILVAEDNAPVRDLFVRVLQEAGYAVISAADGKEALEKFAAAPERIDLVFLDAVMPRLTGVAALKEMRARAPELPAIVCTGHTEEIVGETAGDPLTRVLIKPAPPQVVLAAVAEILSRAGVGAEKPAPR